MAHVVLFALTAGAGNVLYAWYVYSWNRKRGLWPGDNPPRQPGSPAKVSSVVLVGSGS
jgi:hypothetical protein